MFPPSLIFIGRTRKLKLLPDQNECFLMRINKIEGPMITSVRTTLRRKKIFVVKNWSVNCKKKKTFQVDREELDNFVTSGFVEREETHPII